MCGGGGYNNINRFIVCGGGTTTLGTVAWACCPSLNSIAPYVSDHKINFLCSFSDQIQCMTFVEYV